MSERPASLSSEELSRIQQSLRRRYLCPNGENVVEVGFGPARRRGRIDRSRLFGVTFVVRKKLKRLKSESRLPTKVEVRVKRNFRFVTFSFPTDVIQSDAAEVSGFPYFFDGPDSDQDPELVATTGAVLSWRQSDLQQRQWGILTVGHAFRGQSDVLAKVEKSGVRFFARLLVTSRANSGIDASILRVANRNVIRPILESSTQFPSIRKVSQLEVDENNLGKSLAHNGTPDFRCGLFFPSTGRHLIPELGDLKNVIRVHSSRQRAFRGGRSGSSWLISDEPGAMQVAAIPNAYRTGYGQALETLQEWAVRALSDSVALEGDRVSIRAVF